MRTKFFVFILFCSSIAFSQLLIINEIHADPDASYGDANGDGTISSNDDEFVELINNSGSSLDISNWTLSDGNGIRHTFEDATILEKGKTIVVFGGGSPSGIPGQVQVTSNLGLNNSGDDIIIMDTAGVIIDQYTYGSEGGDNQSLARDPDITGDFKKHLTIPGNPVRFSPGRSNSDNSALPVELINFNAEIKEEEILLTWETATEKNNFGFEIQRTHSVNTKVFEEYENKYASWDVIGFVDGYGNSNSYKIYRFYDKYPKYGKNYYRLKQIDFDGGYEYSEYIRADILYNSVLRLEQNYPNPFNPKTVIEFTISPNEGNKSEDHESISATLKLYNSLGQEIKTIFSKDLLPGKYKIDFSGDNLSSGTYLYSLISGSNIQAKKMLFIK